jgi:hypothetical protein
MAKYIFCANCGFRLPIFRKALPAHSAIIDMVECHECLPEPIIPDLSAAAVPQFEPKKPKGKFATKIEELSPTKHFPIPGVEGGELKDHRPSKENILTSLAPKNILNQVREGVATEPVVDTPTEFTPEE